jgi:hypothetical protein
VFSCTNAHKINDLAALLPENWIHATRVDRRLPLVAPSYAFTISRAAQILGEEQELLWDVAMKMEPEDGTTAPVNRKRSRSPSGHGKSARTHR